MDAHAVRSLLEQVAAGSLDPAAAFERLRVLPYEDLGFAKVDHHRALRNGMPEVVFGQGKTSEQIAVIVERIAERSDRVLVTRADEAAFEIVAARVPGVAYRPQARCIVLDRAPLPPRAGVLLLAAGTADLPVAEEAAATAELMGHAPERIYDVGVAGVHRLLDHLPSLHAANVIIVVAGMEGALPSVVGGLVEAPVIAVPTSVGYGASFGGLAALLAMLNSCSAGVSVVNIDNGFGAGFLAARINALAHARPD